MNAAVPVLELLIAVVVIVKAARRLGIAHPACPSLGRAKSGRGSPEILGP